MHVAALHPGGHQEAALFGGIGDVGEHALTLGGNGDAVVGQPVTGGGEDQQRASQIRSAEVAPHQPHRQIFEFGLANRCHHGDARAGFQQSAGFAQRDLPGAHHQHRTSFQIQKDGVVFQLPKCSMRRTVRPMKR